MLALHAGFLYSLHYWHIILLPSVIIRYLRNTPLQQCHFLENRCNECVLDPITTEPPSKFDRVVQFFCNIDLFRNLDLFLFKLHREEYSEEVQKYPAKCLVSPMQGNSMTTVILQKCIFDGSS